MLFGDLDYTQRKAHELHYIKKGYMAYEMDKNAEIKEREGREFTFGCFNHSRKLTSETIELFSEILIKCSKSILALKSISFNEDEEIENVMKNLIS